MKQLVSIIIPCYNYGHFLSEAIESALAQTYQPIEIIVVNDGSTDNTVEVASRYPVQLYNQKNSGACNTFNRGITLARGTYLVVLSADDKLHPQFIEKTVDVIKKNQDTAFVYTHAYMFGNRKGKMLARPYNIDTLKITNYIFGTALMRKDAFDRGGNYDTSLSCLEDYDLWLSFAEHGLTGMLLPEPLFYYRQQCSSRNIFSNSRYRFTMLKIWKKHKRLYSLSEIVYIIILGRFRFLSVAFLGFIAKFIRGSARQKINKRKDKIKYNSGCILVEE